MTEEGVKIEEEQSSISLPSSLFGNESSTLIFTVFNSSVLLPLSPDKERNESIKVGSSVIGATLLDHEVSNLTDGTISITIRLESPVS